MPPPPGRVVTVKFPAKRAERCVRRESFRRIHEDEAECIWTRASP